MINEEITYHRINKYMYMTNVHVGLPVYELSPKPYMIQLQERPFCWLSFCWQLLVSVWGKIRTTTLCIFISVSTIEFLWTTLIHSVHFPFPFPHVLPKACMYSDILYLMSRVLFVLFNSSGDFKEGVVLSNSLGWLGWGGGGGGVLPWWALLGDIPGYLFFDI